MYQNSRYKSVRYQRPKPPRRKWPFVVLAVLVLGVFLATGWFVSRGVRHAITGNTPVAKSPKEPAFDKTKYSLTDPASMWVIVNKQRPLSPKTYKPATLRTPNMGVESSNMQVNDQMATALETMASAAATEGINLSVVSAYRSYDSQVSIYNSEVQAYGQTQADRESARPGYSEHQSGWAADLGAKSGKCRIAACFADTAEGKWLAANAYKYGFIIRYAVNKESITGYMYEPWHVRFIGTDLSTEMHKQNVKTLEEFFGLPAAPNY